MWQSTRGPLACFVSFALVFQLAERELRAAEGLARPAAAPTPAVQPAAAELVAKSASTNEATPGLLQIQSANDYRPVIAASRRLSPATVSEVANGQVTITYSAYNLRDQPVDGVLLTVALAAGVTLVSASPAPDRSGAELAWQLGSLPATGSANVQVTVAFPGAPPARLDEGAKVHAYWAGRGFANAAAPAALRTAPIAAGTIAATPDANPADVSVAAKAAELGFDPTAMFRYVRDSIGNEVYAGSLRGARGALWGKAGNSTDKASLLIAMLRAAGIPARYARGSLAADQARQIIASMFPARTSVAGFVAQGETVSNPLADTTLLAEAADHFWVQYDDGSGFRDLDPSFAASQPGNAFTTAASTFNEIPDNLRHKVTIRLNAETYTSFLFPGTSTAKVLEHTVNACEVAGQPLTLGHLVDTRQIGAIVFSSLTHTYSPYLLIGQNDLDIGDDPLIRGTDYQETLTNFPFGSQVLTGVFLEFDVRGPAGPARTFQRTLFDRIGFAARQGLSTAQVTVPASATPAISSFDNVTIRLDSSLVPLEAGAVLAQREALLQERQAAAASGVNLNSNAPADQARQGQLGLALRMRLIGLTQALAASYLASSDQLLPIVAGSQVVKAYHTSPRVLLSTAAIKPGAATSTLELGIDRQKDDVRGIAAPGQVSKAAIQFQLQWGITLSVVESQLFQSLTIQGSNVVLRASFSAIGVLEAAKAQRIDLIVYDSLSAHKVAGAAYSDDAKARISVALRQGKVVLAPARAPVIGGQARMAWLETDAATGATQDTAEDGTHSNIVALSASYVGSFILAGALGFGSAIIALQCLKAGNVGCAVAAGVIGVGAVLAAMGGAYILAVQLFTKLGSVVLTVANAAATSAVTAGGAAAVGAAVGLVIDPPLAGSLVGQDLNVPFTRPAFDTRDVTRTGNASAGALSGTVQSPATRLAGSLTATWTSAASTEFNVTSINAANATIRNAASQPVGTGVAAFTAGAPVRATASGNTNYALSGQGDLELYAPAGSGLGASGNWASYTATLTSAPTVRITTGSLTLGGNPLPEGTYTITAATITLAGRGPSAAPDFAANTAITASNAALSITPATGTLTLAGAPVDLGPGVSFAGYTGTVGVASGALTDALTITGTAAHVLQTAGAPASLNATQNTPASFDLSTRTSLTGPYRLTAEAPAGWTVAMTDAGRVTVTPAPGTQSGVFPVFVRAASLTDPNLAAHGEVSVSVGATQPGVTITLSRETMFTLPLGGAELPSGYRAAIRNLGPNTNTFQLSFTGLPSGFTVATGPTTFDLPPGGSANLGFFLDPGTSLPAAGTQVPFTARVASTTAPALSAQVSDTFTVPAIAALTMDTTPANLTTTGAAPVTTKLRLRSVGNSAVTATITPFVPAGLALAGLTPSVNLAGGQTQEQTLTLTPQSGAPLGRPIITRFDAAFGNGLTSITGLNVTINAPQAQSAFNGALAANQTGRSDIAATLANLSGAITEFSANPGSGAHRTAVLTYIDFLSAQMNAPYLANFPAELATARAAVASSAPGGVPAALDQLDAVIRRLAAALSSPVAFDFDFFLNPNTATAQPGGPATFQIALQNRSAVAATYTLALGPLPAGVTGSINRTTITLAPGQFVPSNPATDPAVTITPSTANIQPFTFNVTASVNGVAGSARTMQGAFTARTEFLQVAAVTSTPAFIAAGGSVNVAARIANVANQARDIRIVLAVKNSANATVRTQPAVNATLSLLNLVTTVDLGSLNTTGLANGPHTLEVTVSDAATGAPIPGGTGSGFLLIGTPVEASLAITPTALAPGNGQVTATLRVNSTSGGGAADLSLLGSVAVTGSPTDLIPSGNLVYACTTENITTVNVANPGSPVIAAANAEQNSNTSGKSCAITNGNLYAINNATINRYTLTNPANPQFASVAAFNKLINLEVVPQGDHLLVSTNIIRFFFGGAYLSQKGDVVSVGVASGAIPAVVGTMYRSLFTTDGGDFATFGATRINANTLLVGSTTTPSCPDTAVGSGRVLVVDTTDPALPTIVGETLVPGVRQAFAPAISGSQAAGLAPVEGWRNPLTVGFPLGTIVGPMALYILDVSNPRAPVVVNTVPTALLPTIFGGVFTNRVVLGDRQYLFSARRSATQNVFVKVDARNPASPVITTIDVPAVPNSMRREGNFLYVGFDNNTFAVYQITDGGGTPQYTARVRVPKGTGVSVEPGSFNLAPTTTNEQAAFTELIWTNPALSTLTWRENVTGLSAGESRTVIASGGTVDFTSALGNGTIALPPAAVTSEQILGLAPASRTVTPGEQANYTLTVRNPGSTSQTYTLGAGGIPPSWVTMPAQVTVPAGGSANVDLALRSELAAAVSTYGFVVSAASAAFSGSVQGALVLQGTGGIGAQTSREITGVDVALTPAAQTGGIATPVTYTMRVTNTGNTAATFVASVQLPAGLTATLTPAQVEVQPGLTNFRDIRVLVTAAQGTAPGAKAVTARATSTANATITGAAAGTLNLVAQGVAVTLTPDPVAPGGTAQLAVTNRGAAQDTFDLALAGPGALFATLGSASVTVPAGGTVNVPVTIAANVPFALGHTPLLASANSRANNAVRARAETRIAVPASKSMSAGFQPARQAPGANGFTAFLLELRNNGTLEDDYRVRITGRTGSVQSVLRDAAGVADQFVAPVTVPATSTGLVLLEATAGDDKGSTITVEVQSLTDASIKATATAVIGETAGPFADAGKDRNVRTGKHTLLDGSASLDPAGRGLTYRWTLVTRPPGSLATIAGDRLPRPTFRPDRDGAYTARLVVSTAGVDSQADEVVISAFSGAIPPNADAGPRQSVRRAAQATVDGSRSFDPDRAPQALTYRWTVAAAPQGSAVTTASLVNATQPLARFTADVAGDYQLRLEVSDGAATSRDTTVVTAVEGNAPPNAVAGASRRALTGAAVALDGSASNDPDNGPQPLAFQWSLVFGAGTLANQTAARATLTGAATGQVVAQLEARDGAASGTGRVAVLFAQRCDANADTLVDEIDFDLIEDVFGAAQGGGDPLDANNDGQISDADIVACRGAGPPPVVPVTLRIRVDPDRLEFLAQRGQPAPAAKFVDIEGDPLQISARILFGPWMRVSLNRAEAPARMAVTVSAEGFAPGIHEGLAIISATGANSVEVRVRMTVIDAPKWEFVPETLRFDWKLGDPDPPVRKLAVYTSGRSVRYAARASQPWVTLSPLNGETPAILDVQVRPRGLAAGTHRARIILTSSDPVAGEGAVDVFLDIAQSPPAIAADGVRNAASKLAGAVAPFETVEIRGLDLAPPGEPVLAKLDGAALPFRLGETEVLVDGVAIALLAAEITTVRAVMPAWIEGKREVEVSVRRAGVSSPAVRVPVAASAPGVFTNDATGVGPVAANHGGVRNSLVDAAGPGSVVSFYVTGEGSWKPTSEAHLIPASAAWAPLLPLSAEIGGHAAEVLSVTSVPGQPGLMQVNARLAGATVMPSVAGAIPLFVDVDGRRSQPGVTLYYRP
ncbi:MAG: hypothetical protein FJW39_10805 [Acidobacteria bacterium]|nr:hypothetical protein [Acidobacteriota bacterium]